MNGYVEGALLPDAEELITIAVTGGSGLSDEIPLQAKTYRRAYELQDADPLNVALKGYVIDFVRRAKPRIETSEAMTPEFEKFVREQFIDATLPKIMAEGWTLGLAAVRIDKDPRNEWPVPYVHRHGLGVRYTIRIRRRRRRVGHTYRFYVTNRGGLQTGIETRDTKTIIYNEFDAEPVPENGKIQSAIASLLRAAEDIADNEDLARIGAANSARPMVLTQTTTKSHGVDSSADARMPYYGGQDHTTEELREHVNAAFVDGETIKRQQAAFWEDYYERVLDVAQSGKKSVHQAYHNIIPLPPDHVSASYQRATVRPDMSALMERWVHLVAGVYGPQATHIYSTYGGRFQIKEDVVNAGLVHKINRWRSILSRIYTDLFRRAFGENFGEIIFPPEVNDTPDGLRAKWEEGLLTWEGYRELTSASTGIDADYMESKAPMRPLEFQVFQLKEQIKQQQQQAEASASARAEPAKRKRS